MNANDNIIRSYDSHIALQLPSIGMTYNLGKKITVWANFLSSVQLAYLCLVLDTNLNYYTSLMIFGCLVMQHQGEYEVRIDRIRADSYLLYMQIYYIAQISNNS